MRLLPKPHRPHANANLSYTGKKSKYKTRLMVPRYYFRSCNLVSYAFFMHSIEEQRFLTSFSQYSCASFSCLRSCGARREAIASRYEFEIDKSRIASSDDEQTICSAALLALAQSKLGFMFFMFVDDIAVGSPKILSQFERAAAPIDPTSPIMAREIVTQCF